MYPLIAITEQIALPTYLLLISIVCSVAIYWTYRRALKQRLSITLALDFSFVVLVAGFLGARLFHVFYEGWTYYENNPIDILKVWQGGFVYYGGLLVALFAGYVFAYLREVSFWRWADFFAPIGAFGYALGRLGCFFAGCCYGKTCHLPWAVEFHGVGLPTGPRHPTQLYALGLEFLILILLLFLEKKRVFKRTGLLFATWISTHALGRLLIEHYRDDDRGPLIWGLSVSSLISLGLIASATVLALVRKTSRK